MKTSIQYLCGVGTKLIGILKNTVYFQGGIMKEYDEI